MMSGLIGQKGGIGVKIQPMIKQLTGPRCQGRRYNPCAPKGHG